MNLGALVAGNGRSGGGSFTDLVGLAKEITPERIAEVATWGTDVLRHLENLANTIGAVGRTPFAVDLLNVTETVSVDLLREVGRPVNTGWIYNPGETSVQFRYQYTEAEQSGAWIPWLTVPAGHQVSFQSVHIYRIALQPAPGESEASVQIHLA